MKAELSWYVHNCDLINILTRFGLWAHKSIVKCPPDGAKAHKW